MKRLLALLLALLLLLCACTPSPLDEEELPNEQELTALEAAGAILSACGLFPEELERTDQMLGEDGLSSYLESFYGLEPDSWTECVIYRAGGSQALEIAVIRFSTNAAARSALEGLSAYLTNREGDFTGYAPDQAELVASSLAVRLGRFAALLICDDASGALSALEGYLGGCATSAGPVSQPLPPAEPVSGPVTYPDRTPYTQPGIDDMTLYDTAPILSAWSSGDSGGLSEKDQAILTRCAQILEETVTEGMSDLEKERAVYRWIVEHVVYDQAHYNLFTGASRNSYGPYNPLCRGKGVCLGFASTFQLLMDMVGVECITVVGAAFRSREDHAWNMVRLDGSWYCVDATWDTGRPEYAWSYFNVTSDYMAQTDHQWNYNSVPEAVRSSPDLSGEES